VTALQPGWHLRLSTFRGYTRLNLSPEIARRNRSRLGRSGLMKRAIRMVAVSMMCSIPALGRESPYQGAGANPSVLDVPETCQESIRNQTSAAGACLHQGGGRCG
jgi:hypothetical protein